jgi:hypothetical protein
MVPPPPPSTPYHSTLIQFGDRISYSKRICVSFLAMGACLVLLLVFSRINSWALLGTYAVTVALLFVVSPLVSFKR